MPNRVMPALVALGLGVSVAPGLAQDIPDLTGTWTGTFIGGVRLGGGDIAPGDEAPTFVDGTGRPPYNLIIEAQQGRGFMGTWGSVSGSELIQGVIRLDNTELLMVDEDSMFQARLLSPSAMEFCNQTVAADTRFAFCFLLERE